ncbi:carboxy terminal-processing peptidase [Gammaproteobacteria bacterium AS21]
MNKFVTLALTPFFFFPLLNSTAVYSAEKLLVAEKIHQSTINEIVKSLSKTHYNKIAINDDLSSKLLDSYISSLDPTRSYFYQSDIKEFEALRYKLDDELKANRAASGYFIYNRFQQRALERVDYAIDRLSSSEPFIYTLNESFETNREDSPWVTSKEAMNDLWRKRLKSTLLNLTLEDTSNEEAKEKLSKRYKNQLTRLEQTNSEDVFQVYMNNLTRLYDPHTAYFSPRNSENFKINMSLSLQGIGAVLQTEDEFTKIVRLVPSGPADKTGKLKANDRIVGVGQGVNKEIEDIVGWRLDDVVQKIRGAKGTQVRLEVIGNDGKAKEKKTVLITRDQVKLEDQAAQKQIINTTVDGKNYKIGVIEVPTFYIDFAAAQRGDDDYKSTTRDVKKLIEELKQEDIDGLVMDLRDNGGGALQEANQLAGLFLRLGATVQIKYANGSVAPLYDRDPDIAYTGPLAVIVNRQSASASEIFAGAIQDHHRGVIIGNQTFGKGTVQTLSPLKHGQLKLTNAKFYRISGESTQNKGVMPDVAFPDLIDKDEYGESALDHALPWDTVRAVKGFSELDLDSLFAKLRSKYQKRTAKLADFNFMKDKIAHNEKIRKNTIVSLNKEQYKKTLATEKKWLVDAENKRRKSTNQPFISTIEELEDSLEKDKLGRPITAESKAILKESVRVLIDLKTLLQSNS